MTVVIGKESVLKAFRDLEVKYIDSVDVVLKTGLSSGKLCISERRKPERIFNCESHNYPLSVILHHFCEHFLFFSVHPSQHEQ